MCEFVLDLCILLTNKGTILKKFVSGTFHGYTMLS